MKLKLGRIIKDLRAQRESIYGWRFANQSTPLDLMRLGQRNLAPYDAFNPKGPGFHQRIVLVSLKRAERPSEVTIGFENLRQSSKDGRTHKEPSFRVLPSMGR